MKYKIEEERVAFFFFFLIFYDTSITSANNVYITVLEASLWGQNQLIIGKMTEKNKRKEKKERIVLHPLIIYNLILKALQDTIN